MSEITSKQVKVDNWGIYFLQRLKHFFNRTDYCDLTLQFQDNAQLKVHRLVLSACTEYFELLERTCEMYEDCLVMPDDLQADVVVPIINFMYTGQLEFKLDLLERLYQTSLVMNMPVLTKLLDAHRTHVRQPPAKPAFQNSSSYYAKRYAKSPKTTPTLGSSSKRSYNTAFNDIMEPIKMKKPTLPDGVSKADYVIKNGKTSEPFQFPVFSEKNKHLAKDPRPTRYELPEELDEDNIFDNSFSSISYTSKPLMTHPESTKQYSSKKSVNLFEESTSSNRFVRNNSTNDIVECRKISMRDNVFLDDMNEMTQDDSNFQQSPPIKDEKHTSQLFDQMLDNNTSKITIEAKNTQANNIDHAKIISEVLKKYPQLVKSNKNIKLKILNTSKTKKLQQPANSSNQVKLKPKVEVPDFTYESDVINSKEAARLIALGVENIAGPWICLICGTPGKALHFTSYFNFRNHLVDVHNEKPVPTLCEYCGVRSLKRNYLVYHKLTKHGVPAPSHYNFPKCNYCNYIALNEALMVKHKVSHSEKYKFQTTIPSQQVAATSRCNQRYQSPTMVDKQKSHCIYCMRVFLRERNLYAHLKTNHKEAAKNDGLIDDSEEEQEEEEKYALKLKSSNEDNSNFIKVEVPVSYDPGYEESGNDQYQIEQKPDGSIYVVSKKSQAVMPINRNKILNLGFNALQPNTSSLEQSQKTDNSQNTLSKKNEFSQNLYVPPTRNIANDEIVIIDNNEYIIRDGHLIPRKEKYIQMPNASGNTEVTIQTIMPTTSMEYHNVLNSNSDQKVLIKKSHVNQPLQIVVSNEEEYKALMNSNQSVTYNERETNKALAVLTDENQSMETGIDLDNNQSNDMMIIQDDFPMNVSETVSTDNSNIVVVYSHPLEDQNKQYSLIATQGIDGGYVQSSTILTQNYETVTTCTPVMSAHSTLQNSWQNNLHANINKLNMTQPTDLHGLTVGESITITPIETNNLNELPEVHLTNTETVPMQVTHIKPSENNLNQPTLMAEIPQQSSDVAISQQNSLIAVTNSGQETTLIEVPESTVLNNVEQQTISQMPQHTISQMPRLAVSSLDHPNIVSSYVHAATGGENVEPTLSATANPATSNSEEIGPHILGTEILQQDDPNISTAPVIISDKCTVPIIENTIIESNDPHRLTGQNNAVKEHHPSQVALQENVAEKVIGNTTVDSEDNQPIINNTETTLNNQGTVDDVHQTTKVAQEQIENLTSEWSEDEADNQVQRDNISKDTEKEPKIQMTNIDIIEKEVEQSVSSGMEQDTEDSTASSQDDSVSNHKSQVNETSNIDPASQEKISSLLNDWDDNESQEEETSPVVADEESGETDHNEEAVTIEQSVTKNDPDLNKNDKIKSLVSDWDEEDDENKE